ncbi:hypothetical protein CEE45_03490 [Candidatus Heimdallarchaeota archaeon B3_Heim]|nr:MAG: hypothetical protein CEE45_03490 [Candidatus Heimdallarchaeota archaeon B3_Heim]
MSIEIGNISIQTSDVWLFIILGFVGVIIYSTKTFFDVLVKKVTCLIFGHYYNSLKFGASIILKCERCGDLKKRLDD